MPESVRLGEKIQEKIFYFRGATCKQLQLYLGRKNIGTVRQLPITNHKNVYNLKTEGVTTLTCYLLTFFFTLLFTSSLSKSCPAKWKLSDYIV